MMRTGLLVVAVLSLALSGCGDKDEEDGFVTPEKDEQGRYVIQLTSALKFEPAKARVPEGSIVVWKVQSGSHTVEARDGAFDSTKGFNSAFLTTGQEFAWFADVTGDHEYFCDPHESQGMVATLRVE